MLGWKWCLENQVDNTEEAAAFMSSDLSKMFACISTNHIIS